MDKIEEEHIILFFALVILFVSISLAYVVSYGPITGLQTKELEIGEVVEDNIEETQVVTTAVEPNEDQVEPVSSGYYLAAAPSPFNTADSLAPRGAISYGASKLQYDPSIGVYTFFNENKKKNNLAYEINVSDISIQKGILSIKAKINGLEFYPVANANMFYRNISGQFVWDVPWAGNINFQHTTWPNGILTLYYNETYQGKSTQRQIDIERVGDTLVIHIYKVDNDLSPFGNYAGILFDLAKFPSLSLWNPKQINISYMEMVPITIAGPQNNRIFYSVMPDITRSSTNNWPWHSVGVSPYLADAFSNGYMMIYSYGYINSVYINNKVDETFYLTVSNDVKDLFINYFGRNPSPYLSDLKQRAMLDTSTYITKPDFPGNTTFNKNKYMLQAANAYGLENVLYVIYGWSNYFNTSTCNNVAPQFFPALQFSWAGGNAGLLDTFNTANNYSYKIALYQVYNEIYPNSPYWNPSNLMKNESGGNIPGWPDPSCPPQNHPVVAPDKMIIPAQQEATLIKNTFDPRAFFLDVTTKYYFKTFVDFNPANNNSRSIRDGFKHMTELHKTLKNIYQGPLIGEGGQSSAQTDRLQAGYTDGVESEIVNRELAFIIPDFELKHVNKLMMNQGMGFENRWLIAPGWNSGTSVSFDIETFDRDKYWATLIAFGHSTWFSTFYLLNMTQSQWPSIERFFKHMVKNYYEIYALQKEYANSDINNVFYLNASGNFVDLNQALKQNIDFYNVRVLLQYTNGLTIRINRHQSQTWAVDLSGLTFYIPKNGWLATNPNNNFFAATLLVDSNGVPSQTGHRVDVVISDNYRMVDGRGVYTNFNIPDYSGAVINATYLKVFKPNGWWLYENPNGSLVSATPLPATGAGNGTGNQTIPPATPPTVQITQPANNSIVAGPPVTFYGLGSSASNLQSAVLYRSITSPLGNTPWSSAGTQTISGVDSYLVSFTLNTLPVPSTVEWNVQFCNVNNLCAFAPSNRVLYVGAPNDTVSPTVSITSPTNNAIVLAAVPTQVLINAQDNLGVNNVQLYKKQLGSSNWIFIGSDNVTPYQISWSHSNEINAQYVLNATAVDFANNIASSLVTVTVNLPPIVTITSPANGTTVSGSITITATVSEPVSQVQFYHDSQLDCTDTTAPYSCTTNTNNWTPGQNVAPHTITVQATETITGVGTQTGSASITVNA